MTWPLQQLRRMARIRNGSDHSGVVDPEGEFPVYGSGGEFARASRALFEGPAVLLGRKGTIDKPLLVDGQFWIVDTMFCAQPLAEADPRFLYYACTTIPFGMLSTSTALPSMTQSDLKAVRLPCPPFEQQLSIADFLDHETAEIDALVGKQEQLIATLREDRAATIDFAFPAAAGLTRLKAVLLFAQTGPFGTQLSAEEYIADGIPVINPTHIQDNKIVPDVSISVSAGKADDLARHRFRIGDIVLGRKGEVDKSALVDTKSAGFICGSDAMLLRPRLDVVVPAYLWWFLQSPSAHSQLEQWSVGSTVAGLNQTTMRKIYLPHPRLEVQRQIVDRLEVQTAKVDALVAKAGHVIETLCEYRSAIITDAVTGQIDVREAV